MDKPSGILQPDAFLSLYARGPTASTSTEKVGIYNGVDIVFVLFYITTMVGEAAYLSLTSSHDI